MVCVFGVSTLCANDDVLRVKFPYNSVSYLNCNSISSQHRPLLMEIDALMC